MTQYFFTSSVINPGFDAVALFSGDGVHVKGRHRDCVSRGRRNLLRGGVTIENHGVIFGASDTPVTAQVRGGIEIGTPGKSSTVTNGLDGTISGGTDQFAMLVFGAHAINNFGQVTCQGLNGIGVQTYGSGSLYNYGIISAGTGVLQQNPNAGDLVTTINYGTINALSASYYGFGSQAVERITNAGTMTGDVYLGDGTGSSFDTSQGRVDGQIIGGNGGNRLTGSAFEDSITGGTGADIINGNAGGDLLYGGAGADRMYGGSGTNTLTGGLGNDSYYVDSETDIIVEAAAGGASDYIFSTVSFSSVLGVERLYLLGNTAVFADGVDAQNDFIAGNSASNIIDGKSGNDTIRGGFGNDTLTGGLGLDMFQFLTNPNATFNRDTITDFTAADDVMHLDNLFMTQLGPNGALAAGAFNTGAAASQADDRVIYNTATGALLYDPDGSGVLAAVQFATLTGAPVISAADFVVV